MESEIIQEKIELDLAPEEKVIICDTLMEHNVSIFELVIRASDQESQQHAGMILQGTMFAQHHFVEQMAYGNNDYLSNTLHLVRPVLEAQIEKLEQMPPNTENVLAMAEVQNRIQSLKNIVDKLPERPTIATP